MVASRCPSLGGRPARIVADVTFDTTPRPRRTAADVLRLGEQLAGYSASEAL
jgi:hypothetical protein